MFGTRGVLAVAAGVIIAIGIFVLRSGRQWAGLWLLTAGFFIASLWSGLSIAWTKNHSGEFSLQTHILLGTTAIAATIYYGMLAREVSAEQ